MALATPNRKPTIRRNSPIGRNWCFGCVVWRPPNPRLVHSDYGNRRRIALLVGKRQARTLAEKRNKRSDSVVDHDSGNRGSSRQTRTCGGERSGCFAVRLVCRCWSCCRWIVGRSTWCRFWRCPGRCNGSDVRPANRAIVHSGCNQGSRCRKEFVISRRTWNAIVPATVSQFRRPTVGRFREGSRCSPHKEQRTIGGGSDFRERDTGRGNRDCCSNSASHHTGESACRRSVERSEFQPVRFESASGDFPVAGGDRSARILARCRKRSSIGRRSEYRRREFRRWRWTSATTATSSRFAFWRRASIRTC